MSENKKELTSRTFSIMQFERHPETGEILLTEKQIADTFSKYKSLTEWAWVTHDKDVYNEEDQAKNPKHKAGETKPRHFHIAIRCKCNYKISQVSKWFGISSNFIKIPKGNNRAFADCLEYLTHENEKQLELGKHHYADDEIKSNFDFRTFIDTAKMSRSEKMKTGVFESKKEMYRYKFLFEGMTRKQLEAKDIASYLDDWEKLDKLRMKYLAENAPVPTVRQNFYVCGSGGIGKNFICKMLAKSLLQDYIEMGYTDDELIFEAGPNHAVFEGYTGQPCIIWNDFRAYSMLESLGGRGNVFNVFDTFPSKTVGKQNIKYGSVRLVNKINIVNGVDDWSVFLDGLAGEYVGKSGEKFTAEDKSQSYRRFPHLIPIEEDKISFMINKGYFEGTREYEQYEEYYKVRVNMSKVAERCRGKQKAINEAGKKIFPAVVDKFETITKKFSTDETELNEDDLKWLGELDGLGEASESEAVEVVVENESCTDQVQLGDGFKLVSGEVLPFAVDSKSVKKKSGKRKKETV